MDGEGRPERVADYFVVVGLDPEVVPLQDEPFAFCDERSRGGDASPEVAAAEGGENFDAALARVLNTRYRAEVIDRFPQEDHPDSALPPQVAMFALPEGLTVKESCPLPTFCVVVFTGNEGKRLYASVLTFHEEVPAGVLCRMLYGAAEPPAHASGPVAKTLWLPKCICSLSHWLFFELHREFLKQLYRVSLTASRVPIERLICNLIYEVPLPPRGRVRVQYSIADQTCKLARAPANQLPCAHVPLDMLFELLDRSHVLDLFSYVLLEYKILFFSKHPAVLTMVTEALLSLIFPFRWHHVYIPVLPLQLLEFVNAPTPFIMGVHPGPLQQRKSGGTIDSILGKWSPDDVVIVNLDENHVRLPPQEQQLPPLPHKLRRKLMDHLLPLVGDYDAAEARRQVAAMDLAFTMAPTPAESDSAARGKRCLSSVATAQVQYGFFRSLLSLLRNYRDFLTIPTADDPAPPELLRKQAFLQSTPKEARRFLASFVDTHMFLGFLERRIFAPGCGLRVEG